VCVRERLCVGVSTCARVGGLHHLTALCVCVCVLKSECA